jgi:hypothetical protein
VPAQRARHPRGRRELYPEASKAEQDLAEWQAAVEALLLVVELSGPTMMARICVLRALNRHIERVFDASRKVGKLKRDQQTIGPQGQAGRHRWSY